MVTQHEQEGWGAEDSDAMFRMMQRMRAVELACELLPDDCHASDIEDVLENAERIYQYACTGQRGGEDIDDDSTYDLGEAPLSAEMGEEIAQVLPSDVRRYFMRHGWRMAVYSEKTQLEQWVPPVGSMSHPIVTCLLPRDDAAWQWSVMCRNVLNLVVSWGSEGNDIPGMPGMLARRILEGREGGEVVGLQSITNKL